MLFHLAFNILYSQNPDSFIRKCTIYMCVYIFIYFFFFFQISRGHMSWLWMWYFSLYDKNVLRMYDVVGLFNKTGTSCGVARTC